MTYVQKNCKACGDLIEVRLADHKRGWGNFCDKACSAAYKCNQRPKDVNAFHAKFSQWAEDRMKAFTKYPDGKPPIAPSIKSQVGKVKVVPKHHSPKINSHGECIKCGNDIAYGDFICISCEEHQIILDSMDYGWDGHKDSF